MRDITDDEYIAAEQVARESVDDYTEQDVLRIAFQTKAQNRGVAVKIAPNLRYLPLSVPTLAALLRAAKDAHTAYEAEHGPDEDWPTWYAEYILGVRDA